MESLAIQVERGPEAALDARRALLARDGLLPHEVQEDVLLLMTELITNAVRHGGDERDRPLTTEVRWRDGSALVEVTDPSDGTAVSDIRPDTSNEGGWGLFLVEQIADRWGFTSTAFGTRVWFELVQRGEDHSTPSARSASAGSR